MNAHHQPRVTDLAQWAARARGAQAAMDAMGAGRPPTPPPPPQPMPEPVRVPRTPPRPPRGWEAAVAGTCSHGGHDWDGEPCDEISEEPLPGMPASALIPGDAIARAEKIAPAMTADQEATPRGDDPWTTDDVIGVALARGLESLEELYGVKA